MSSSARSTTVRRSASDSACSTTTFARDRSAAFTSNDGFSVVAPTSTIVPASTWGKQRVLLALVEAVDLVDEQHRPLPLLVAPRGRLGDRLAQLLDARHDRRERHEPRVRLRRQQPAERGLPGPGRAPQNQRRQLSRLERAPQQLSRPEQVCLPDKLAERPRPHPLGQWLPPPVLGRRAREEIHRPAESSANRALPVGARARRQRQWVAGLPERAPGRESTGGATATARQRACPPALALVGTRGARDTRGARGARRRRRRGRGDGLCRRRAAAAAATPAARAPGNAYARGATLSPAEAADEVAYYRERSAALAAPTNVEIARTDFVRLRRGRLYLTDGLRNHGIAELQRRLTTAFGAGNGPRSSMMTGQILARDQTDLRAHTLRSVPLRRPGQVTRPTACTRSPSGPWSR